ncbi:response regulator [Malaciobacter canalis]|uniref:response regulator n=1 Tax=Malaciobacter canalis TaxID=1912871 RepID=UPI00384BF60C
MKRVVFVDDSKTVLASVELALENLVNEGVIEIICFINPKEFLHEIQNNNLDFDLLFTDVNMPQMNGLELSKEVKKIENTKRKPILVLTTENSDEMKKVGKEIGVTGWVVKPFSEQKIIMAVKRVLKIR